MKKTLAVTLGILMMGLSSFASNEIKRLDKNEIKKATSKLNKNGFFNNNGSCSSKNIW